MVYFLIGTSVLENHTPKQAWEGIQRHCGTALGQTSVFDLDIEKFKLGNLDSLFHNTEIMQKLETQFEGFLRKIERQYLDITNDTQVNFQIEGQDQNLTMAQYLLRFQWQDQKFPRSQPLTELINGLKKRVEKIEESFKKKSHEYQEEKNKVQALTSKEGNYYVRDLADVFVPEVVRDNDFQYSDHLQTVVVVVPKQKEQEFLNKYQDISEHVLPGSAKKFSSIAEKDGLLLYRVVLFKKELNQQILQDLEQEKLEEEERKKAEEAGEKLKPAKKKIQYKAPVDAFTFKCREEIGVTVREFKYNKAFYENRQKQRTKLQTQTDQERKVLTDICRSSFNELYIIYMHLKHLRLVVEIATRFGQREKVLTAMIHPQTGKDKQVVNTLTNLFCEASQRGMYGTKEELEDTEDFYPFVYVPINHF